MGGFRLGGAGASAINCGERGEAKAATSSCIFKRQLQRLEQ